MDEETICSDLDDIKSSVPSDETTLSDRPGIADDERSERRTSEDLEKANMSPFLVRPQRYLKIDVPDCPHSFNILRLNGK